MRKDVFMVIDTSIKKKSQLERDIEAAAYLGMSYGHYKAYQRSVKEKRKKRRRKARLNRWTKEN